MREPTDDATLDDSPDATASASVSFEAAADRIADRYEILGLIGSGGMGNVYRVRDLELDEVVALKFLRRELLDSPGVLDRFRQEVKLARRVTHANVARTFDIGEHAGEKFLTMEFIDGSSLGVLLARDGALRETQVIEIGLALCAALAAAHGAGVIHRDLKPDNILLDLGGRVVVTDFGIACARSDAVQTLGRIVGTPTYMAPEQVQGLQDLDGRVDIYALGAVLFELLAAAPAWSGDSFIAVAARRLHEPPPDVRSRKPGISAALAAVVQRCLAMRREDRYQSADELAAALRSVRDARVPSGELVLPRSDPQDRSARTVAVLPFRNTGGADEEYIADELTDDLIDALSSLRELRVRPRRALPQSLPLAADLTTIGRELDVQVVVEGSVRRRDGMIRISARALSVSEGLQLWARRFERPAQEVLAINDEVARSVAEALCASSNAPRRVAPASPEAVLLYLRARQTLRHGWTGLGNLTTAVELFERGLALAPDDIGMLAGYAMARARQLNYSTGPELAPNSAFELASRAITLAPHLGEPWLALATVHFTTSNWSAAARALRTALNRSPGLQKAHEMLAAIEVEVGCEARGLKRYEQVLALDPGSWPTRVALAYVYSLLDRDDAVAAILFPASPLPRATVPEEASDYRARQFCLNRFESYRRRSTTNSQRTGFDAAIAIADTLASRWAVALANAWERRVVEPEMLVLTQRVVESSRVGSRFRPLVLQCEAELFGFLGDGPRAIAAIARAVDSNLYDILWLDRCPLLDCARLQPEFASLRAQVEVRAAEVRAILEEP
jgi:serine/threonine protein kinase